MNWPTKSELLYIFTPYFCALISIVLMYARDDWTKNDPKYTKRSNFWIAAMAIFMAITAVGAYYTYRIEPNKNSDSKDADKTAQVQKLRTAINNHTTANWNNFTQKVK